jgi:hypothetical protein
MSPSSFKAVIMKSPTERRIEGRRIVDKDKPKYAIRRV